MATSGSPQAPSQPTPVPAAAAGGIRRSTRIRRQVQSIYDDAKSITEKAVVIAESGSKGKRKKRTKRVSPLTLPIYNLPDLVLLHITRFMKHTLKRLLAVALTASSERIRKSNYVQEPFWIVNSMDILISMRIKIWPHVYPMKTSVGYWLA